MSSAPVNTPPSDDQLASKPQNDGRQASRVARLNVGAGVARRATDANSARDDTAAACFNIFAERVEVTTNFNFG
nr:putative movement protein 1 [Cocksfoot mild mosaic virus]